MANEKDQLAELEILVNHQLAIGPLTLTDVSVLRWARDEIVRLREAVQPILELYERVATGETQGAGGCFYADGKGTLNGIQVDIEPVEALAKILGCKVHARTSEYRKGRKTQG